MKLFFPYKAENLIWKIFVCKKNQKSEKLVFKSNFFPNELSFSETIPPGLKMSQKGSWKATHS